MAKQRNYSTEFKRQDVLSGKEPTFGGRSALIKHATMAAEDLLSQGGLLL